MYANGTGVLVNFLEALRWLRKAHAQGNEFAAGAIELVLQAQSLQPQAAAAAEPPTRPPSPPISSPSSSCPIPIGSRVELHGLRAKKLNRQRGVVVGFDAASRRCEVKLEDGRGQFSLELENLRIPP
jgi:TPR repeat protein